MNRFTVPLILLVLIFIVGNNNCHAGLILTIDNYTSDQLTFSIDGTFDADTEGQFRNRFGIKNDWSNNVGVHTEMFAFEPIVVSSTVAIDGVVVGAASYDVVNDDESGGTDLHTDYILFSDATKSGFDTIPAGTEISGSMTLSGVNAFDPNTNNNLQLVSGISSAPGGFRWERLEANATAVPEPSSAVLSLAAVGLVFGRRYRSRRDRIRS